MKLRLVPVVLSVLVSSIVLFGGWFVYHSVAMESPLSGMINSIDGVEHSELEVASDQVTVFVQLKPDASLRAITQNIKTLGASIIKDRKLVIQVTNVSTDTLDRVWSNALFGVAQAMESRQYSEIPAALKQLTALHKGIAAMTEMDDDNVYIRLMHAGHSKFVILPREPAAMGVWPHE